MAKAAADEAERLGRMAADEAARRAREADDLRRRAEDAAKKSLWFCRRPCCLTPLRMELRLAGLSIARRIWGVILLDTGTAGTCLLLLTVKFVGTCFFERIVPAIQFSSSSRSGPEFFGVVHSQGAGYASGNWPMTSSLAMWAKLYSHFSRAPMSFSDRRSAMTLRVNTLERGEVRKLSQTVAGCCRQLCRVRRRASYFNLI